MANGIPTPPYDGTQKPPQHQQQQQAPQASRKSSNSSTSSTSGVVPSSRTAKSGNGSGSNATASHTHSTHQHHHNSHRASKRSGTTPTASHSHSHSHHAASSGSHHSSSVSAATAAAAVAAATHSHGSPHHDGDGRHKRVWKACERCRMKKTKVWHHMILLLNTEYRTRTNGISASQPHVHTNKYTVRWRVSLQALQRRRPRLHRRHSQEDRIQATAKRVRTNAQKSHFPFITTSVFAFGFAIHSSSVFVHSILPMPISVRYSVEAKTVFGS